MASRAERSRVADWWFTVDKLLIAAFVVLIIGGIVLSLAASPAVAERIGIDDTFHFVKRQAIFAVPAIAMMIGLSFLDPRQVRRLALVVFVVALVLLVATLFVGAEVKGSRRAIYIAGQSVQASEYMKPAFAVLVAFLLAEGKRSPDIPGQLISALLFAIIAALLIAEPDFGQTMLTAIVWASLVFMAGMSWFWIFLIGGIGVGGVGLAYMFVPHVTSRIDRFLNPESGDTFQVDTAIGSFVRGGWFGAGPGEGTMKRVLPDSHTDFIFAVAAEEYGIVLCIAFVCVFAFIVLRGLKHAFIERDMFVRLAVAGLTVQFGIQASINLAVNLHLMPAKGMTLPFISYGGSSMMAMALTVGLLLALTRKRPQMTRYAPPIESYALAAHG